MVVNRVYIKGYESLWYSLLLVFLCSCKGASDINNFIDRNAGLFPNKIYHGQAPVAQLINLPNFTDEEDSFELKEDASLQVYGSGELLYDFANSKSSYFFLSDDIELFFSTDKKKKAEVIFAWNDAQGMKGKYMINMDNGIKFMGFAQEDSLKRKKYFAEISIPWTYFSGIKPENGTAIPFDIAIGDMDNHFVQEGKIAWVSKTEPLIRKTRKYGTIILCNAATADSKADIILSIKGKPDLDWDVEDFWQTAPFSTIKNVVVGTVKDKYDLSARIKSSWNKDSLYFLIEISDQNHNRVWKDKLKTEQTFLDYGWIEDDKGTKIWEMHALNSRHSGGALKNHQVDTVLNLKKGKYKLKYSSDESHAYGNWDDEPPSSGFYGLVIYNKLHTK